MNPWELTSASLQGPPWFAGRLSEIISHIIEILA